jgi:dinuclear metal center YbgI/SA1388 family protein
MVKLNQLVDYCDDLLEVYRFKDYAPNGLQVQGADDITTIISGVTACQALIDKAVEKQAQLLLVHHGYFWRGEDARLVGMKRQRIASLFSANLNLLAYHLPLDAHPVYGNNAQLAEQLGLIVEGSFGTGEPAIGLYGSLPEPMAASDFGKHLGKVLGRVPMHIPGESRQIRRLAWCTGAAQGYIEQAQALGVDAYLSGEISEQTVHIARETGMHYFAAGHHATERYGAMALGLHLAQHFGLNHEFVDIDNPV